MRASEKRIEAMKRNIERKQAKRHEGSLVRRGQAQANDLELKRLCIAIATLQAKNSGEPTDPKSIHPRCEQIYKTFRELPAHKQPAAFAAGVQYVQSGGNVGEFLKFGGANVGKKLEEHSEPGAEIQRPGVPGSPGAHEESEAEVHTVGASGEGV